jgi:predicted RNase H-like HicB family nuclease
MNTYTFRTIITPDEGGTFHGYAPALPGCHTWGNSLEETRAMLKDAIGAYIASLIEDKEPVPQDSGYETLETIALPSISPAPSYV